MKSTAHHLTARQIVLARDGALPEGRFARHLDHCADCQARVLEARRLAHLLQATLTDHESTDAGSSNGGDPHNG